MTRFTLCLFAVVISINCTADDSSALIKTLHELTNVFNRDDVRKELEVLDDQAQEIAIHGKENNRRLKELESQLDLIPSEEFIRRIKEFSSQMGAENEAKRKEVLLPFQLRRLDELTWQYRSLDEPIRAYDLAVQLSEEQKTRMREREAKLREELLATMWNFKRRSEREILELLAPEQRKEWMEKVGKEFEFDSTERGLSALSRLH